MVSGLATDSKFRAKLSNSLSLQIISSRYIKGIFALREGLFTKALKVKKNETNARPERNTEQYKK